MYDEEPYHGYCGPTGTLLSGPLISVLGDYDGLDSFSLYTSDTVLSLTYDDDMASGHADCAGDENRLTSKFVDIHYSRNCCYEHDNSYDSGGEQRYSIGSQSEAVKDLRGVVLETLAGSKFSFFSTNLRG